MEKRRNRQNIEVRRFARDLACWNPTTRAATVQLLREHDGSFRRQVIIRLMRDIKATRRWMLCISWTAFVIHLWGVSTWRYNEDRWWWRSIYLALGAALVRYGLIFAPLQRRRDALTQVIAPIPESSELVGCLLDAIRCSGHCSAEIGEALERSVALVRTGEPDVVNREQRQWMIQYIGHEWDNSFSLVPDVWKMDTPTRVAMAMIRLLAAVGGAHERQQLERLARKQPATQKQKSLHLAIVEVLPAWKTRLEAEQVSEVLLRAAAAPADPQGTLLRAASGTTTSDPQQMLRASEPRD